MVKLFALIPPRHDLSLEEFHDHWRSPHGEMATGIDTMRRYVQCHRMRPGLGGLEEAAYEGIAEVWFEDIGTAQAMGEHPVYVEQVQPDEEEFIDLENLAFLFADEVTLTGGPVIERDADTIKAMVLVRRRSGVEPAEFSGRWHGRQASSAEECFPQIVRHAQSLARPENYAEGAQPRADGIEELTWADRESFEDDWAKGRDAYLESLAEVTDAGATMGFLCTELRLVWP